MTLIDQPQLFSKPIQNPLNLIWTPVSSLPSFNPLNFQEVFHYLEITNAQETNLAFWNLREKFPLVNDLIDTGSIETQEISKVCSISDLSTQHLKYGMLNYAQELSPSQVAQSQQYQDQFSQFSQFFQPTPPPSPYPSSHFLPPVSSTHLYSNSTNLPLPIYPESSYRFPLPPPPPPSSARIGIDYHQLNSPPSSAMAMNCFHPEGGIGLGLDLGLRREDRSEEEIWWWG